MRIRAVVHLPDTPFCIEGFITDTLDGEAECNGKAIRPGAKQPGSQPYTREETKLLVVVLLSYPSSKACSTVYILAIERKPRMSPPRMRFPASQFNGLSALGSVMRDITARQTY